MDDHRQPVHRLGGQAGDAESPDKASEDDSEADDIPAGDEARDFFDGNKD